MGNVPMVVRTPEEEAHRWDEEQLQYYTSREVITVLWGSVGSWMPQAMQGDPADASEQEKQRWAEQLKERDPTIQSVSIARFKKQTPPASVVIPGEGGWFTSRYTTTYNCVGNASGHTAVNIGAHRYSAPQRGRPWDPADWPQMLEMVRNPEDVLLLLRYDCDHTWYQSANMSRWTQEILVLAVHRECPSSSPPALLWLGDRPLTEAQMTLADAGASAEVTVELGRDAVIRRARVEAPADQGPLTIYVRYPPYGASQAFEVSAEATVGGLALLALEQRPAALAAQQQPAAGAE
eukprot:TRINITY_DN51284_c0_g1_i1.p1 TRINITY_DN51284_c0_g1~~TRINITY_DN51284_c0_g1_i1.p1  ORF type:complete len:328 (+),score=87.16 TRINITY_DN51284_c0_g1_i1:108-986(+)